MQALRRWDTHNLNQSDDHNLRWWHNFLKYNSDYTKPDAKSVVIHQLMETHPAQLLRDIA